MFDASDPMLEARLCEATEGIFRRLLENEAPDDDQETGDVRLEAVAPGEVEDLLRAACRGAFADAEVPPLDEGAGAEFDALLAEICSRSHGAAQHRAAHMLRAGGGEGVDDLESLTRDLAARLRLAAAADAAATDAVVAACRRLAATVLRCTDRLGGPR